MSDETRNQIRRLSAERDVLLLAIAPEDYAKVKAKLVAIAESPDEAAPQGAQQQIVNELVRAARLMDWQQVVGNGGPPCFHLQENGMFCGRAARWDGHDARAGDIGHRYLALAQLLAIAAGPGEELLRLLADHRRAMIAEDQLHPHDDKRYIGTKLYLETEAAIERANGKA